MVQPKNVAIFSCILTFLLVIEISIAASFIPSKPPTNKHVFNNNMNRNSFLHPQKRSGHFVPLSMSVDTLSVETMSNDHEKEGARMAKSIAVWLDIEWCPQEIHVEMGNSAKKSYISCRENGDMDIMSIMMKVGDDLESNWQQYDKDAFVNAWDVANYVSDYLTKRAGIEGCSCNHFIHEVEGFD